MHINCHSYFSLRYGTVSPKELVKLTIENNYSVACLTDINNTSGCLDFVRKAQRKRIKPVIGVDVRNGVEQQFILLAKNNNGFQQINTFVSEHLHQKRDFESEAPVLPDVFVIYPFDNTKRKLKKNEFIGIKPKDLATIRLSGQKTEQFVILQSVTFQSKRNFNTHRLLRAIDNNTLLSKLPLSEQGSTDDVMLPREILFELYGEFPKIIKNTNAILNQCSIDFDLSDSIKMENQQTYTGNKEKDVELLWKLCEENIEYRYPNLNEDIRLRIEKELETIQQMNFVSYFLINWDIVNYARQKGYFYVGRGSGANSVIAYLLRITNVDPIELDLYFERFINAFRSSPPDFDIDFSWKDRDDVTRYIFERFDNVALVATYNTFQQRAVVRELGKVFGLPKNEIDKISRGRVQPWEHNELYDLVLKYAQYIHGLPSHLSIHASGIIISERPIHYFSATFLPPKGYPTIQFDMHISEDVGLYKFDILSQRGLSKIKDTLDVIAYNQLDAPEIDIDDIQRFKEDKKIKHLLRNADAMGCFYVESPAMRMLLKKLQVEDYLGLVAASSVIRPGVAKSGMMQAYIQRFRFEEKRKDAHPILLELMPETFGVMVYQEDVIKVAYHFAGLTLGEADKMRRGMSGKYRSREEFQAVKDKFFKNCIEKKGHSYELTQEIWRQTESFAGYAFAKGHSASYAVESYQCLFLKAYYPIEFMVATINNYGGFFSTELYVHEAKKYGATIHPPCINLSWQSTVVYGKEIYLGFHLVKSLESKTAKRILEERKQNGPFLHLNDFIERVPISTEQISLLIRLDAFRFTKIPKRTLLWEGQLKTGNKPIQNETPDLFRIRPKEFQIPQLTNTWQESIFDEMELLGFPLHNFFDIVLPNQKEIILAKNLIHFDQKEVWIRGYLVHRKRTTTSGGQKMFFGTFIDQEGEWLDTVHFPNVAKETDFRGRGVYLLRGIVKVEMDCVLVEVNFMEKMGIIEDPRYSEIKEEKFVDGKEITTSNRHKYIFSRANKDRKPA